MSSFIIEKVVLLPCVPYYRKKDSKNNWEDLYYRKLTVTDRKYVPEEVIDCFENGKEHKDIINSINTHKYSGILIYNDKVYSFIRTDLGIPGNCTYIYRVGDTIDKYIEDHYDTCLPLLKQIESMIGKKIEKKDLPLYKHLDPVGLIIKNETETETDKFIITLSVAIYGGRVGGGGDDIYINSLTDFCELYCSKE